MSRQILPRHGDGNVALVSRDVLESQYESEVLWGLSVSLVHQVLMAALDEETADAIINAMDTAKLLQVAGDTMTALLTGRDEAGIRQVVDTHEAAVEKIGDPGLIKVLLGILRNAFAMLEGWRPGPDADPDLYFHEPASMPGVGTFDPENPPDGPVKWEPPSDA